MSEAVGDNRRRVAMSLRMLASALLFAGALAWGDAAEASLRSQVLYARGLVPYHDGQWEQAFELFDSAVAADENDALALYYRGLTQARRGANEAAVADIRRALQVEPRLPNAPLDLGVALFDLGQFADAQRALRVAHARDEQPAKAAFFLGLSAYRLGDYDESRRWFAEAGQDEDLRQASLYYSGLARLRAGDEAEGRMLLQQAAEVAPDSEIGRQAARFAATPGAVQAAAEAAIERRWSLYAETRLEYDSNVNAGASDGVDGTDGQGDGRPVFFVGGRYQLLSVPAGTLQASADLGQSVHFSEREFDLSTVRLMLDWNGDLGRFQYGASGGYEFFALDYGAFSQSFLVQPWAAFHATETTATQAYWRFRYRDFLDSPFDPFRDGLNNAVGLRQHWLPLPQLLTHIGYQFEKEKPEDTGDGDPFIAAGAEDFEYVAHQFDLGGRMPWELPYVGVTEIRGGYRFRYEDYDNPNSRTRSATSGGAGEVREDFEHTFALQLANQLARQQRLLGGTLRRLDLTIGLIALFNDSNISEFEHNRVVASVGVHGQF